MDKGQATAPFLIVTKYSSEVKEKAAKDVVKWEYRKEGLMLNISTSRDNNIVEQTIFEQAIETYQSGKQVYLLVPEQYTLENEINLMNLLDQEAVSGIRVMSFQRLALETLSKVGGLKRIYIDNLGKSMILKNILYNSTLNIYASTADKEGFVQSLLNQIAELKRSMIRPEMLKALAEKTSVHSLLAQKLTELAFIYEEMENALGKQYVDNEARLGQLAEVRDLTHLQETAFFVFGFLGFTALELEIIRNLLSSGIDMHIGLCLDLEAARRQEESVFTTTFKSLQQLEDIAYNHNIALAHAASTRVNSAQNENIHRLGAQLFKTIPESFDNPVPDIKIFAAHSVDEEIHYIARDITKNVVDNHLKYNDFMVVSTQSETYNSTIKQVFAQYQIPVFIDEKRAIINSPIVKTIIALLNLLGEEFKLEDIMVFLKNGFASVSENEIYVFENYMLRRRFKGRMFLEDKYFSPRKQLNDSEQAELEIVLKIRTYLLDIFALPIEQTARVHTALGLAEQLMTLLDKIDLFSKIQILITELQQSDLLDEANENNQVWNIVANIMEQAAQIFGEQMMSVKRFKELFIEAVKSHKLAVIPPSLDQVIIGDMDRSRSDSKRIMYLCGVNSGFVPKAYKESAILTQEEKLALADSGLDLPSKKDNVLLNDLLTLYIMLTRAEGKLVLTYATEGGKLPAMLIGQITDIFPQLSVETDRDLRAEDVVSMPRPTLDAMSRQLKKFQNKQHIDDLWFSALAYYAQAENTREMTEIALAGLEYTNDKANLRAAKQLYRSNLNLSTTRLTSFVECPFKHFVRYGLSAKERKEYAIESAELGIVLHDTMEQFIQKLVQESPLIATLTKEQTDKIIDHIFDDSVGKMLTDYDINDSRNQFLLERQRKTARHIGYISVENIRKEGFALFKQEESFGYDNSTKVAFDIAGEEINLVGTIDRIDILRLEDKLYVKIIDYKTRDKEFSLSDAYNGVDIQLLLYLYVALSAIEEPTATILPAGAFYFPVINPIISTKTRVAEVIDEARKAEIQADGIIIDDEEILERIGKGGKAESGKEKVESGKNRKIKNVFSKEEIYALIDHVMGQIYRSVERMLEGEIQAHPISQNNGQRTACDYCRYAAICKFEPALGDNYRYIHKYDEEQIKEKLTAERIGLYEHKLDK